MLCFVWKQLSSIINTVIEILLNGILLLIKMLPDSALKIDYPFIKAYRVEPALLSLGETER